MRRTISKIFFTILGLVFLLFVFLFIVQLAMIGSLSYGLATLLGLLILGIAMAFTVYEIAENPRQRKIYIRIFVGILMFFFLGIFSNLFFSSCCERHMARWLSDFNYNRTLYVPEEYSKGGILIAFKKADVPFVNDSKKSKNCAMARLFHAKSCFPYIFSEQWTIGTPYEMIRGEHYEGTRNVICFFGITIDLGDWIRFGFVPTGEYESYFAPMLD